jgi:hypothetical protein
MFDLLTVIFNDLGISSSIHFVKFITEDSNR